MECRTLTAQDYLRPDEAFHLAQRKLERGAIKVLHDHDYVELFWIVSGAATHVINGQTMLLSVGCGALIRPSDRHGFSPQGSLPCHLANVMFRSETAARLLAHHRDEFDGHLFWHAGPEPSTFTLDTTRRARFAQALVDLEGGPRSRARIEGFLLTALTSLAMPGPESRAAIPVWLDAAINAARRPEVFRAGAAGFIGAAGRSHEHVCRCLKTHFGVTPSMLVNQMRMEHAGRLLIGTDLVTADIAVDCGIDNMSHFHALFRDHFGMTPRRYRLTRHRDPVQPALRHN